MAREHLSQFYLKNSRINNLTPIKSFQIRSFLSKLAVAIALLLGEFVLPANAMNEVTQLSEPDVLTQLDISHLFPSAENSDQRIAQAELSQVASAEAILAEINRLRTSPADYADWLESLRPYYEGTTLRLPGERGIRTVEGILALEGAISALSQRHPVPPLMLAQGLLHSTNTHLDELLAHNRFTLSGLDGSTSLSRAERYGSLEGGLLNEILSEGFGSAETIVAALVLDDGNRSRATQDALLSPAITSFGTACGVGVNGKPLCVMAYATQYASQAEPVAALPTNDSNAALSQNQGVIAVDESTWFGSPTESQLSTLSSELIAETNLLRADPSAYAEKLIALRPYYEQNLVKVPGHPIVEVVEGVAALDEAISVLQSTRPLFPLLASNGMAQGANDHAADLGDKGLTGHYGSDGSDPFTRINRYGSWDLAVGDIAGENISYGHAPLAEWHIIQLLVDDNVPNRGHRQTLLNSKYQRIGSDCEAHREFRIVCVMTYASDYREGHL